MRELEPAVTSGLCASKAPNTSSFSRGGTLKCLPTASSERRAECGRVGGCAVLVLELEHESHPFCLLLAGPDGWREPISLAFATLGGQHTTREKIDGLRPGFHLRGSSGGGSSAPQLSQRSPIIHRTMIEPGAIGTGLGSGASRISGTHARFGAYSRRYYHPPKAGGETGSVNPTLASLSNHTPGLRGLDHQDHYSGCWCTCSLDPPTAGQVPRHD